MKEDISERISSYWNAQICVDFRASIFSLFQIYSINFFVLRYIIQWNKNYNTSHFFVNEISVFQHKFHQQFFRQTSRRSRRHHELFVENKMLQKPHTCMHHNTPILIHFQQDWCFSIFKPNFFLARKLKSATQKRIFKRISREKKRENRKKKGFSLNGVVFHYSLHGAIKSFIRIMSPQEGLFIGLINRKKKAMYVNVRTFV